MIEDSFLSGVILGTFATMLFCSSVAGWLLFVWQKRETSKRERTVVSMQNSITHLVAQVNGQAAEIAALKRELDEHDEDYNSGHN